MGAPSSRLPGLVATVRGVVVLVPGLDSSETEYQVCWPGKILPDYNLFSSEMFAGPFDDNPDDDSEEDNLDESGLLGQPASVDEPLEDFDDGFGELPWEGLNEETANQIEDQLDDRMGEHDDHREVVVNQEGVGASFSGVGGHSTTSLKDILRSPRMYSGSSNSNSYCGQNVGGSRVYRRYLDALVHYFSPDCRRLASTCTGHLRHPPRRY